jgi:hypothetical protein
MIVWREKLVAFGLHFLVTLALAGAAAALIFLVWFPDPFGEMLGGAKLFVLVVGCDLALGPLMSLVIYNRRKARKLLVMDYTIVGIIQLAAIGYGIYIMSSSRPVYVVFTKDSLTVVAPSDYDKKDLQVAPPQYRSLPLWGPQLMGARSPTDSKEKSELLFAGFAGRDIQVQPRYYVPYDSQHEEIRKASLELASLEKGHPDWSTLIDAAAAKAHVPRERLRWLPVNYGRGFWSALIDTENSHPVAYLPIDAGP